MDQPKKIAFVCLGNICRSPTAEAIMKNILQRENIKDINVESYGTSSWHIGSRPDPRAIAVGEKRGVAFDSTADQLTTQKAKSLDLIFVMDSSNYKDVTKLLDRSQIDKVKYLGSYEPGASDTSEIPDTYYGDQKGFEKGFEHISRCCEALFIELTKQ